MSETLYSVWVVFVTIGALCGIIGIVLSVIAIRWLNTVFDRFEKTRKK